MAIRRSRHEFLHRSETNEQIEKVASADSLLVYAGAGASIDRIGMDWSGLVTKLLTDYYNSSERAERIVERWGPLQAATIACALYEKRKGAGLVRDTLRKFLYDVPAWRGGRLTRTIASLGSSRVSFGVLTTNFDDYLEQDLISACEEVRATGGTREFRRLLRDDDEAVLAPGVISCSYLHGYIPDLDRPIDRGTQQDEPAVLSEANYMESSNRTVERLTAAFAESDVVIVGSSMTDPPLLQALYKTRKSGHERYAMLPLQQWEYSGRRERHEIREEVTDRLADFGVEAVFPDFYFQVSQFLRECISCARHGPGSYASAGSEIRYGRRLLRWWKEWYESRSRNISDVQSDDHRFLMERLELIRDALKSSKEESLKLEVWLRWDPDNNRRLRLWASSTGTWPDINSMRDCEVDPDSEYACSKAFCHGRPILIGPQDQTRRSGEQSRWQRYFACPIWLPRTGDEVPVGVVALASMKREESTLSEENRKQLEIVRQFIEDAGEQVARARAETLGVAPQASIGEVGKGEGNAESGR